MRNGQFEVVDIITGTKNNPYSVTCEKSICLVRRILNEYEMDVKVIGYDDSEDTIKSNNFYIHGTWAVCNTREWFRLLI